MSTARNFSKQSVIQEQFILDLNEHGVSYTRVSIESLLNTKDEDEAADAITLDTQAACFAGLESVKDVGTDGEKKDVTYNTGEELKTLAINLAVLERQSRLISDTGGAIRFCWKELRL